MSARAWLAFAGMSLVLGLIIGWSVRVTTTSDRYIRSLAEKHEAAARYWDTQANNIITNNTLERKRRDGKKKD